MWSIPFTHVQLCFSCYAVVATQLLEFHYAKHNRPMRFSVQQIVDCTSHHCQGGTMEETMAYMSSNPIAFEHSYTGSCSGRGVMVDYHLHRNASPERIKELLKEGPLGVGLGNHMSLLLGYNGSWVYADHISHQIGRFVVQVTGIRNYI